MKKHIVSGLMGFGISVGCLLPPILHFVTGPLGPLIGGFAGGMKSRAKFEGALLIGLIMGICLAVFLFLIGFLIMSFRISMPGAIGNVINTDSLSTAYLLKIALIPFSIAAVLGTIGAFLGGKFVSRVKE